MSSQPELSATDLPTSVKYEVLQRTGALPQEAKVSKNAAKKAAKKAAKASKGKKSKQQQVRYSRSCTGAEGSLLTRAWQLGARNPPVLTSLEDGQFGDLKCIQSRWKTGRVLVRMAELTPALNGQKVWVRGRVHTTRAKGVLDADTTVSQHLTEHNATQCRQKLLHGAAPWLLHGASLHVHLGYNSA